MAQFKRMRLYQITFLKLDLALAPLPLAILIYPMTKLANRGCFNTH